jgi:hypothetical protein
LFRKVLDDLPAWVIYDQSELVNNDSLRLHDGYLDPIDMLWKEWQMLKGEVVVGCIRSAKNGSEKV